MTFVSFSKSRIETSPGLVVDRLRSAWVNPGVYLILEGVNLELPDTDPDISRRDEHVLIAFEKGLADVGDFCTTMESFGLGRPVLWEEGNAIRTVNEAAEFYLMNGKTDYAILVYRRLVDALSEDHVVLSNAGRFSLKAGNTHLARSFLSRARELAPDIPEIAINYFALLCVEERKEEAAGLWAEIRRKHPDHPAVRWMGSSGLDP